MTENGGMSSSDGAAFVARLSGLFSGKGRKSCFPQPANGLHAFSRKTGRPLPGPFHRICPSAAGPSAVGRE